MKIKTIFHVPIVPLRDVTERVETPEVGTTSSRASDKQTILRAIELALALPTDWSSANQPLVVPLKLFDYMGLGVPAVVSDFPEMRRIAVETCRFGLAVPPKNSHAIRDAISRLASDPARRESMRKAAMACFEHTFAWERQREILEASHPIFRADGRR